MAPSDHIIPDIQVFHQAISVGLSHAQNGNIVTFGIRPTHPETGYGYLKLAKETLDKHNTCKVVQFIEKPDRISARQMLESKNFMWNAGIFLFRASDLWST